MLTRKTSRGTIINGAEALTPTEAIRAYPSSALT